MTRGGYKHVLWCTLLLLSLSIFCHPLILPAWKSKRFTEHEAGNDAPEAVTRAPPGKLAARQIESVKVL